METPLALPVKMIRNRHARKAAVAVVVARTAIVVNVASVVTVRRHPYRRIHRHPRPLKLLLTVLNRQQLAVITIPVPANVLQTNAAVRRVSASVVRAKICNLKAM